MPTLATRKGSWTPWLKEAYHSEVFFLSVHLTPRPQSLVEHLLEPYTEALLFSSSRV